MPLPPNLLVYLATRPWQLGDVATWLSAAASAATLILALAAAIVGYQVYKVESGRDARAESDRRDRTLDERRSQASVVSTWYGRSKSATTMFKGSGWSTYSWGAWVVNASDSPIYDAIIRFYHHDPEGTDVTSWPSKLIRVVPPYRGEMYVDVGNDARKRLTDDEWKGNLDVSLEFRDAAGRYWLRDRHGYLHELARPTRETAERQ